jgi:SAM-dependent methyltransferase
MPSVNWNKKIWDEKHHWDLHGDEWSSAWKNSEMQWYFSIFPRIHKFLPVNSILELGPGHGRWSQFLAQHCHELHLVDLSQSCIKFCQKRFQSDKNIYCYNNDGFSLDMIKDNSVDFVFSFDSLVHVEENVIDSYLSQVSRKLTQNGVGFIHHSNLGSFTYFKIMRRIEQYFTEQNVVSNNHEQNSDGSTNSLNEILIKFLLKLGLLDRTHMRAITMHAERFNTLAKKHGLKCVSQEIISWGQSRRPIDCLTTLTPQNSIFSRNRETIINKKFMVEAGYIRRLSKLYNFQTKR